MSLVNVGDVSVQWNGILTTTGSNQVIQETPNGSINGTNATFTVDFAFDPDTVEVYVNGIHATSGVDYTTSGTLTINFTYSLAVGDVLRVNYKKA
jgi:hypothetical protein